MMKSHFGDYMKFNSYIKRQNVMQSRSESMMGAVTARNSQWADVTKDTTEKHSAKKAKVEVAKEKLDIANKNLESRRATMEKSINVFEKAVATKKVGFVAKSSERSSLEGQFQEQTGDIQNLMKHKEF